MLFLRFIPLVVYVSASFLFMAEWYAVHWRDCISFMCPSLWVVFTFWALWIALLWTYMYKDFFEHLFSILLGIYLCCCCSVAKSCPTLCDSMNCSTADFSVLQYLQEVAQTHVHGVSDSIQPSHPLSPPSPTAFSLSQRQGLFQWVGSWHQVAKVLELQFEISPSNDYSGLISFRMDWFDLLVVQGTPKSLFQHHNSKASILWCSAFFIVQFSHPYMTTGKTIALTRWTFVGKVMSLLFICCLGLF